MKLGKTARIILIVGIFAVALFMLYRMNSQEEQEQEQLNMGLDVAQLLLPKLISEKGDLESQLAQLQSDLAEATASLGEVKVRFPKSVESIEYDEVLCQMAHDRDLEIMSLTATEPNDEKIEDVTYTVTSFQVEVEGKVADMLDFVSAIANGEDFITATVKLVSIEIPEPVTETEKEELTEEEIEELTEEEIEEAKTASATIKLVVYSYKGE